MTDELLDASFFVPTEGKARGTIAQQILATVAGMRQRNELHQSLCWSPEELERLAMFAIDAKNRLASASSRIAALRQTPESDEITCAFNDGLDAALSELRRPTPTDTGMSE